MGQQKERQPRLVAFAAAVPSFRPAATAPGRFGAPNPQGDNPIPPWIDSMSSSSAPDRAAASSRRVCRRIASLSVLLIEAGRDFPREKTTPPLFTVTGEHSWLTAGIPEFDWELDQYRRRRHPRRTQHLAAARAPRRRHLDDQRHDRRPRRAVRFRPLGGDGQSGLGLGGPPAAVHRDRERPRLRRSSRSTAATGRSSSGAIAATAGRRSTAPCTTPASSSASAKRPTSTRADGQAGVVGPMPHNRYKEVRLGTLVTYLRAARPRRNLTIRAECHGRPRAPRRQPGRRRRLRRRVRAAAGRRSPIRS